MLHQPAAFVAQPNSCERSTGSCRIQMMALSLWSLAAFAFIGPGFVNFHCTAPCSACWDTLRRRNATVVWRSQQESKRTTGRAILINYDKLTSPVKNLTWPGKEVGLPNSGGGLQNWFLKAPPQCQPIYEGKNRGSKPQPQPSQVINDLTWNPTQKYPKYNGQIGQPKTPSKTQNKKNTGTCSALAGSHALQVGLVGTCGQQPCVAAVESASVAVEPWPLDVPWTWEVRHEGHRQT